MRDVLTTSLLALLGLVLAACSGGGAVDEAPATQPSVEEAPAPKPAVTPSTVTAEDDVSDETSEPAAQEKATFGAGCFWCVEAVLEQLDGVTDVTSGYMGGHVDDPTYKQICTGTTGHAEVVQVTFEPSVISYEKLLDWFWKLHDPTTLNQQGADVGTQYRSAIFFHSDEQRATAERSKAAAQADFADPIVTEITEASTYYEAEDYHQDYYRLNTSAGYCRVVIAPKLNKLGLDDHVDE
jgi:peptide-methionine (S)-S-oxide reductase